MKSLFLIIVMVPLIQGCPTLPDKPTCLADSYDSNGIPLTGKCIYPTAGNDFVVDNSGQNNYTLDGHNWTLAQLIRNSFILPPETLSAEDQFYLDFCHDYPSYCEVTPDSTPDNLVKDHLSKFNLE